LGHDTRNKTAVKIHME